MSDLIRTVRGPWTAPPQERSLDVRPAIPRDTYRFTQNQIEAAERQNQRATNRIISAQNINSAPQPQDRARFTVGESINALITLIVP